MNDPLATYLQDHLAGADMAMDLLQSMEERQKDGSLCEILRYLLDEVKKDRVALQHLADKVGSGADVLKEFSSWLSGKASRVKLGADGGGDFGTFEALEFLALGVLGKRSLWRALQVAAASDVRLRGPDFDQLIGRAEVQYAKVEERRLAAAVTALRSAEASSPIAATHSSAPDE